MTFQPYGDETPADVKNAKVSQILRCLKFSQLTKAKQGLHLITQNTPNGQKVQIFLEELADAYGTEFTFNIMLVKRVPVLADLLIQVRPWHSDISTNEQKKPWFLRLDPNGKPV